MHCYKTIENMTLFLPLLNRLDESRNSFTDLQKPNASRQVKEMLIFYLGTRSYCSVLTFRLSCNNQKLEILLVCA